MASKKPQERERDSVDMVRQQQHTGNHERGPGEHPDRFAGTRAGAENVEPKQKPR
jgi:hypothetical protein